MEILMQGVDLSSFWEFHTAKSAAISLLAIPVEDAGRYGEIIVDTSGKVLSFEEKKTGGPGFINGGIYILNSDILFPFPESNVSLEREMLPHFIGRGL
jgi:NDP-sugar pyrophosphorylase family protein